MWERGYNSDSLLKFYYLQTHPLESAGMTLHRQVLGWHVSQGVRVEPTQSLQEGRKAAVTPAAGRAGPRNPWGLEGTTLSSDFVPLSTGLPRNILKSCWKSCGYKVKWKQALDLWPPLYTRACVCQASKPGELLCDVTSDAPVAPQHCVPGRATGRQHRTGWWNVGFSLSFQILCNSTYIVLSSISC